MKRNLIFFILPIFFLNHLNSQYFMEWESPIGLELEEFESDATSIKRSSFLDFNLDGNVEIVSKDENDNFYFYDILTHQVLWSWFFSNTSESIRYDFIGFTTLTDNGIREAIFYQNEEDESNNLDDYCLIINTQTNQVFQIELNTDEHLPGIWGGNRLLAEGLYSEFESNENLEFDFI